MDINVSLDTVITMVAWAMLATGGQLCWKKTHCIVDNQYDTKLVYCVCEMAVLKTNNYSKTRNKKKNSQQCENSTVMQLSVAGMTHTVC
jgi:hypothetical protein